MKFLFKMSLLVLIFTSNFIFGLLAVNQEDANKVETYIFEIIYYPYNKKCNCEKLNTLNYEELNLAEAVVLWALDQEIKNENKVTRWYDSLELKKNRIEKQKECTNKVLTTINRLKNQNKSE